MNTPSKKCIVCKEVFYNLRLNAKGQRIRKFTKDKWTLAKFCSQSCRSKYHSNRIGTGDGIQLLEKVCAICKCKFLRSRRTDKQWKKAKFCSLNCLAKSKVGVARPDQVNAFIDVKHNKGKDHWNWKGGITEYYRSLRHTKKYKNWRNKVYERDYWTCTKCNVKCTTSTIVAHHIKSFRHFAKLRYIVLNGVTLCRACHKKTHYKIGVKTRFK